MKRQKLYVCAISALALAVGGCSPRTSEETKTVVVHEEAPGTVQEVWEEPMVDVVDVPPGLDPEGTYYRPGHQEVVEIRQGRWQYYNKNKE